VAKDLAPVEKDVQQTGQQKARKQGRGQLNVRPPQLGSQAANGAQHILTLTIFDQLLIS
jgi:hypothetical protein